MLKLLKSNNIICGKIIIILCILLTVINITNADENNSTNAKLVKNDEGILDMQVDGKKVVPLMLYEVVGGKSVYRPSIDAPDPSEELVKMCLKKGIHQVYSMPFDRPAPSWFKGGASPDYSYYDKQIQKLIALDPQARIIVRIRIKAPAWWKKKYPDHVVKYQDGRHGSLACPASDQYRKDVYLMLRDFIRHMEKKFPANTIGYLLGGQNSWEWLYDRCWDRSRPVATGFSKANRRAFRKWLQKKYKTPYNLSQAWGKKYHSFDTVRIPTFKEQSTGIHGIFRDPLKQRFEIDFSEFMQDSMYEVIVQCSKIVKEETDWKKLSVVFYGYRSGALGSTTSGHLKLDRLLASPYVDTIGQPYTYIDRVAGGTGYLTLPIGSIQLHEKQVIMEDDTRSHIASSRSFGKTKNLRETTGVFRRNFSLQLQHNCFRWWMDFGSGWNAIPEIVDIFKKEIDVWKALPHKLFYPEVAVIIDEESPLYMSLSTHATNMNIIRPQMSQLNLMGCPIQIYNIQDVYRGLLPAHIKLFVFLETFKVNKKQRVILQEIMRKYHAMALWFYAPGFLSENNASPRNINKLTGIAVGLEEKRKNTLMKTLNGQKLLPPGHRFGSRKTIDPLFRIIPDQTNVTSLAQFAGSDHIGLAMKTANNWTSVLNCGLVLDAPVLRELARKAGVHIYCNSNDVIRATNDFVAIHAASNGEKTLILPQKAYLIDVFSGNKSKYCSKKHKISLQKGDTRIFRIESYKQSGKKLGL